MINTYQSVTSRVVKMDNSKQFHVCILTLHNGQQ